ncbi:MAG: HAMP domain-containing protein, partial [Azoarcus sp.]|nr:HAMP domain-containing protein [Azoarcus sp.]
MEEHTHTIRPQTESAALEKRIFRVSNLPPRTLLWRIFLLFALLLVLVFGIWGQIFNYYHDEPVRARDAARMAVNMVNLTREALINTDPGRRNDFLIALSTLEKIHIYPAEPDDEIQPLPDSREMRLFVDEARRGLGENTRFASRWKTLDGLWISFHLTMPSDPDEYWIMLPFDRGSYQSAYAWLFWGGASLLAAILAAYLIVSHISLPLRRLAHAARQIGSGQTPAPFEEKGPLEIAVVAKAFNQMTASLTRAADDRALLLAGVSHDLRTPLARLRLETELQDTAFDRASMIADIEAMDRIIGQFLDYGRDTARTPMQPVDLVPLIAHIAAPYIQRGTQIKIDAPPQLPARAHPLSLSR